MNDHPVIVDVVPGGDPPYILVAVGGKWAKLPLTLGRAIRLLKNLLDYVVTQQTPKRTCDS